MMPIRLPTRSSSGLIRNRVKILCPSNTPTTTFWLAAFKQALEQRLRSSTKTDDQPFGVDVAFGDPISGDTEGVVAEDVLAFAGVAPPTLPL
jgi:hypothetical protein